jgi:hypothetical protein
MNGDDMKKLLSSYAAAVEFPAAHGFEIVDTLSARSQLARIEEEMELDDRRTLEHADRTFLRQARTFYASLSAIVDLVHERERVQPLPSHWWWWLDEIIHLEEATLQTPV